MDTKPIVTSPADTPAEQPAKWCSWCKTKSHDDAECRSTRPAGWKSDQSDSPAVLWGPVKQMADGRFYRQGISTGAVMTEQPVGNETAATLLELPLTREHIEYYRSFVKNGSTGLARKQLIISICDQALAALALQAEVAALKAKLAEATAKLACGHPQIADDSYGGCAICSLQKSEIEGSVEIERLTTEIAALKAELASVERTRLELITGVS